MIIKITFKDNDYTQLIERYLDKEVLTEFFRLQEYWLNEEDYEVLKQTNKARDAFRDYIREGIRKMPLSDKFTYEEMLKVEFLDWVHENTTSFDHLKDQLEITITNRMTSKWENGEVVYYFPSQHKYITQ